MSELREEIQSALIKRYQTIHKWMLYGIIIVIVFIFIRHVVNSSGGFCGCETEVNNVTNEKD